MRAIFYSALGLFQRREAERTMFEKMMPGGLFTKEGLSLNVMSPPGLGARTASGKGSTRPQIPLQALLVRRLL